MGNEKTDNTLVTSIRAVDGNGDKQAYILFLSGPLVGKLCALQNGETVLGRSDEATIKINDGRISRRHVSLKVGDNGTVIADLGSTNGTYVNGNKVQSHTLQDGDKIQISSTTIFKFAYQDNIENIFHKELYKMAVIDPLTGAFNKRYFLDRLREEFSHALRSGQPLSLMMLDLDHFKQINDTHGHLVGDAALQHFAKLVQHQVRTSDIFARYGGEEFAAILRNSDAIGAFTLAERIRSAVQNTPGVVTGQSLPMTVSIGVATLGDEIDLKEPKDLIEVADGYLYQSKQRGRNRTTAKKGPGN